MVHVNIADLHVFHQLIGIQGRCSVHLINNGVTSAGAGVSVIEWGLSSPADVDVSVVTFTCTLDDSMPFQCK